MEEIHENTLPEQDISTDKATLPSTGDVKQTNESQNTMVQSIQSLSSTAPIYTNGMENNDTDATMSVEHVSGSNEEMESNIVNGTQAPNHKAGVERKVTIHKEVNREEFSKKSIQISTKFTQSSTKPTSSSTKSQHRSSSPSQTAKENVYRKATSGARVTSEDTNFREIDEKITQTPCFCDPARQYTQASLVMATIGGIFVGSVVIFLLFYVRAKCKRYIQGDYRRVPMEYDFELNPRFKSH